MPETFRPQSFRTSLGRRVGAVDERLYFHLSELQAGACLRGTVGGTDRILPEMRTTRGSRAAGERRLAPAVVE
jgi:hypothetical protein